MEVGAGGGGGGGGVCGEIHCKSQNFLLNRWKAVGQSYSSQLPLDFPLLPLFRTVLVLKSLDIVRNVIQTSKFPTSRGGRNLAVWPSRDKNLILSWRLLGCSLIKVVVVVVVVAIKVRHKWHVRVSKGIETSRIFCFLDFLLTKYFFSVIESIDSPCTKLARNLEFFFFYLPGKYL